LEALGQEGTLDRHINTRALESRSLGEGAARNACMHGTTCMPLRPQLRSDQMASWAPHAHTTSEGVRHSRASPRPAPPSASLGTAGTQMLFFFNVSPRLFFSLGRSLFRSAYSKNYYVTRRTRSLSIGSVW
jgi:hypothetical protein